MKISEIIEKLKEIQKKEGDVDTSCDFRAYDKELWYDEDLKCILGD